MCETQPQKGDEYALELPDVETASVRVTVTAENYHADAQPVTLLRGKTLTHRVKLDKMADAVVVVPPPVNDSAKTKCNAKDGAEMILIPAGEFAMGDNDDDYIKGNNPCHKVRLSAYYIYKNLVTVGQYEKFCNAMGKTMPSAPSFN